MINDEKFYFIPGTICRVRHSAIDNRVNMWVVDKVSKTVYNKDNGATENVFIGIKCRWFDKNGVLRDAVFSTKDLEIVNE